MKKVLAAFSNRWFALAAFSNGWFALIVFGMISAAISASNNTLVPTSDYHDANAPTETTISVSSTTVVKSTAVTNGVIRFYQNTGSVNVSWFYNLSSSNTVKMTYIVPGQYLIEDKWFGDVYFKSVQGNGAGVVSYKIITNIR